MIGRLDPVIVLVRLVVVGVRGGGEFAEICYVDDWSL